MSDILIPLVIAAQAASGLAAVSLMCRPGVSHRAKQRALDVFAATTLLAGVANLLTGHTLLGAVTVAVAVMLPIRVRRVRGRKGEQSKR